MQPLPTTPLLPLLLLVLILAGPTAADVLVVDASAGAGTDFTALTDAVSAAADGDTLLVRSGDYAGGFDVDGKSLAIVAEAGADVNVLFEDEFFDFNERVEVKSLSAGQTVVLRGLEVRGVNFAVWVNGCAGHVVIEDCHFRAPGTTTMHPAITHALFVADSSDVTLARSRFDGESAFGGNPTLYLRDSTVRAYAIEAGGSNGNVTFFRNGGPVLELDGATLFLQGSHLAGGAGADGFALPQPCDGLDGGAGTLFRGAAELHLLDASVTGGPGGAPGDVGCSAGAIGPDEFLFSGSGTAQTVVGSAVTLTTTGPVRGGTNATFAYDGEVGASIYLLYAAELQAPLTLPVLDGTLQLDLLSLGGDFVGTVPGSGTLDQILAIPLYAGFDVVTLATQPLALNTSNGRLVLGSV